MRLPLFLTLLPFLLTQTAPPASDPPVGDPPVSDPPTPDPEPEDVSGLKSALEKERAKRKQYETDLKAAREAQTELDRLKAEAKTKADAEAVEQGKWEELAGQREAELTKATETLTATTATLGTLEAYVKADIDAVSKAVKDAAKTNDVAAVLQDIHPGDDADVAALIAWLDKAKPRMAAITGNQTRSPGNGPNPPAASGARDMTKAYEAARANPKYSI